MQEEQADERKIKKIQRRSNNFEQMLPTLQGERDIVKEELINSEQEVEHELQKQRLKIGQIEIIMYKGLIEETRGGIIVINLNEKMKKGVGTVDAIFNLLNRNQLEVQTPASIRFTTGLPHWDLIACAEMTDCRAKLCTIKRSETEAETIMSSLIQSATNRQVKIIHLTLIGIEQYGHSVTAVISGMIKGIMKNSEAVSLKINLLMSDKDREEFKQIYNEIKKEGKEICKSRF